MGDSEMCHQSRYCQGQAAGAVKCRRGEIWVESMEFNTVSISFWTTYCHVCVFRKTRLSQEIKRLRKFSLNCLPPFELFFAMLQNYWAQLLS